MTTICWDGTTLAADRQITWGNSKTTGTKLYRLSYCPPELEPSLFDGSLVGIAGDADNHGTMVHWLEVLRADPNKYPSCQNTEGKDCSVMLITPRRQIYTFGHSPYPFLTEDKCLAMGSGMDFALAAMYCGKTAAEAVEVAAWFDRCTGRGCNTLTFEICPNCESDMPKGCEGLFINESTCFLRPK